jgi:hypothetical protein
MGMKKQIMIMTGDNNWSIIQAKISYEAKFSKRVT